VIISSELLVKINNFVRPFYDEKDCMHGLEHLDRIIQKAEYLSGFYPDAQLDVVVLACCFHGLIKNHNRQITEFLDGCNLNDDFCSRVITAAQESLVEEVPGSLEGKIVHDAHLIEGGRVFLVVKSLVTGTARGQSLAETIDYMRANIFDKGKCYLPESAAIFQSKQDYLREFLGELA